mgnify:FL=1|tara:strand:- start:30741 stop:31028 length:288 start_codon:yes stop_codon:yes gene_type:complete
MYKLKLSLLFFVLVSALFFSLISLVFQIYEHRKTYAELDNLKINKSELLFESSLLINEVHFLRNQSILREVALTQIGMKAPEEKDKRTIYLKAKL